MASSVNNTTGLSPGSGSPAITKRNLGSYAAQTASEAIARANYQKLKMSDARVAQLRQYLYQMVVTWNESDMVKLLQEYGDLDLLRGRASKTNLAQQLVEAMIINMSQSDLEVLLKDIQVDERKMVKEVKNIKEKRKREAKKYFTTGSFEQIASKTQKMRSPRKIAKFLRKSVKRFSIPRNIRRQFPKLKKEIRLVLKDFFDKLQVGNLAIRMNIEVGEAMSFKEISELIANKTILYVALLTGKTKKMYGGAFLDISPFNEILQYTSYAYITGDSSLTVETVAELRKAALAAQKTKQFAFNRRGRGGRTRVERVANRRARRESRRLIERSGFEVESRTEQLKQDPEALEASKKQTGSLTARGAARRLERTELARTLEAERLKERLKKGVIGSRRRREIGGRIATLESLGKPYEETMAKEELTIDNFMLDVNNIDISRALPVYVVNSIIGGSGSSGSSSGGNSENNINNSRILAAAREFLDVKIMPDEEIYQETLQGKPVNDMSKARAARGTKEGMANTLKKKEKQKENALKNPFFSIVNNSLIDLSGGKSPFLMNIGQAKHLTTLNGKKAIRVFDESRIAMDKKIYGKGSIGADLISNSAKDKINIDSIRQESATPVYVINKDMDVTTKMDKAGDELKSKGLKLALNAAGLGFLAPALGLASGGYGRAKFAKGSVGAATGSNISQFIAGDSLNGKPNEEQVSID